MDKFALVDIPRKMRMQFDKAGLGRIVAWQTRKGRLCGSAPPFLMLNSNSTVTQRDIAKHLGLSNATVSLALRDSPRIPEERRKQIRDAAEKMGYRPNPAASMLAHQKRTSRTVPIHSSIAWLNLWPCPEDLRKSPLFDGYWQGAHACAHKFGFRLEEFALAGTSLRSVERILIARGIEGVLVSPEFHRNHMDLDGFDWNRFCAVRTSRFPLEPALHLVTTDQAGNAMLAFDRVLALGYRRVGFVGFGASAQDRIWQFENGYLAVQRELPEDRRLSVFRLDVGDPASREGLRKWMMRERPDALLSIHPELRGLLGELGFHIPEEVGLATLNIADCHIEAGIDQDSHQIGRRALLQLLSLMQDHERGVPDYPNETLVKGRWMDGPSLPAL